MQSLLSLDIVGLQHLARCEKGSDIWMDKKGNQCLLTIIAKTSFGKSWNLLISGFEPTSNIRDSEQTCHEV